MMFYFAFVAILAAQGDPDPIAAGRNRFQVRCAGCHGALSSSTKLGRKPSVINTARGSVPDMMGQQAVMALTQREVEAISYVLGGR